MKVICISQCQHDRKELFLVGKEYDIPEELYNKEFFQKVEETKTENRKVKKK